MIPMYDTRIFSQIYTNAEDFLADWKASGIYESTVVDDVPIVKDETIKLIFFLLYAKYGNNPVANYDLTQFQYKLWSTIFQYGPSWEKRKEIQQRLRELDEKDILTGTKMLYNHAYNPSSTPSTDTLEEIQTINEQNTSKVRKGLVEAYTQLWDMIATDVTSEFIKKFAVCFKQFVMPSKTHIFTTDIEEDEEDYE